MSAPPTDALTAPWWARLPVPGEPGRHDLVAVVSAEFPADGVVELPPGRRPSGWRIAVRTDPEGRVHSVETVRPGPLLWYVEVDEPGTPEQPAAVTLLAFSDTRFADGTVLDADRARTAGVRAARQVAALRWWPGSGLVHQLYVAEQHRRRGIAGKLSVAAYGMQVARGLPALHGDGRRTELGESWRQAQPAIIAGRLAPLTELVPPMTPGA